MRESLNKSHRGGGGKHPRRENGTVNVAKAGVVLVPDARD
jgi:hypothetical protein